MIGLTRKFACLLLMVAGLTGLNTTPTNAQQRERLAKADAPVVADGIVQQVFRSARQGRTDYLIQITVKRSEAQKALSPVARAHFPAPGETIYVHIGENHKQIPEEGSQIRVYVTDREQGGWDGAFPDWFDATGERREDPAAGININNLPPASSKSNLGMTTEVLKVQNRIAVRVVSVERGGPAAKAGLEVGDVIAGIEGEAITAAGQLEAMAAKGKPFSLIVVDVNTGKGTQIELDPGSQVPAGNQSEAQNPLPEQPAKISLGISAEPVALGTRSALKVTGVKPESPADKAGVEVGDILVAANGAPLTGPEQLLGALRKSGPVLKLTVRDTRTGRDTEVSVNLTGTAPTKPLPAGVDAPVNANPGSLGAVTELAFNDDDFAVKITEVEPNSAAARAGLRPGILVLAANGKPVLHPNDLNDAVRKSNGNLKLTVVDPANGRKGNVDVNLGR
jgi:serine protease Do